MTKDNVAGDGYYALGCSICGKRLCRNCEKYYDRESYCKICFSEGNDESGVQ
jgi:hypothetical protein